MITISGESFWSSRESRKLCSSSGRTDLPPLIGLTFSLGDSCSWLQRRVRGARRSNVTATPEHRSESYYSQNDSEMADQVPFHGCCPPVPLVSPPLTRRRVLKLVLLLGQDRCHVFVLKRTRDELFVSHALEGGEGRNDGRGGATKKGSGWGECRAGNSFPCQTVKRGGLRHC